MAISDPEITHRGQLSVSTLGGQISLEEATGRLVVRRNNAEITVIDVNGLTYSEPSGLRRIRTGAAPDDGRIGDWISKPGEDVIVNLGGV